MNFKITWNDGNIENALKAAFQSTNDKFGEEAQREISAVKWIWPRPPSPRDIVDLGQLRDSYEQRVISPTEREHSWNARHAMANHEGARYREGSTRPPRRWTLEPMKRFGENFGALAQLELERLK